MDISPETISKYKIKKVLKISILTLLFFVIGLLIFEYFRITPRNVYFSNLTSSSVTVSWNTKSPTSATVIPFEGKSILPIRLFCFFKEKFFDTRDVKKAELEAASQAGLNRDGFSLNIDDFQMRIEVEEVGKYFTHHITVKGLDPEREYSFMIGDTILFRKFRDSKGSNTITTLSIPEELKTPYPAYGLVKDANNIDNGSINDLSLISDGVIYFNYLDKKSGERSNIFSSSLEKNGSWYMDVSSAVDQKGDNFLETHSTIDNDILVELVLNAGEKGIWKSLRPDEVMSPAQPIIINLPNSVQDADVIDSVIQLKSSLNPIIGKVFARTMPDDCGQAACEFSKFCGPCFKKCSDGYWYSCACDTQTLANRQCNKNPDNPDEPLPEPENPPQCSGGFDIDETTKYGTNCLVCKKRKSGDYYIAAWETDNVNYDINNNCKKKQDCEQRLCSVIGISDGYTIESSDKQSGKNYESKPYTECGVSKTCYKEITGGTVCPPITCAQLSNTYPIDKDSREAGHNYDGPESLRTGCGDQRLQCYKDEASECVPPSCAQLMLYYINVDGYDIDASSKKPGIDYESHGPIYTGCGFSTIYCYKEIGPCTSTSCGCEPKTCFDLTNGNFPLDSGSCGAGRDCRWTDPLDPGCDKNLVVCGKDVGECDYIPCSEYGGEDEKFDFCPEGYTCETKKFPHPNEEIRCPSYCRFKTPLSAGETRTCQDENQQWTTACTPSGGYECVQHPINNGNTICWEKIKLTDCSKINSEYSNSKPSISQDYDIKEIPIRNDLTCYKKDYTCTYLTKGMKDGPFILSECTNGDHWQCISTFVEGKTCYKQEYNLFEKPPQTIQASKVITLKTSNKEICPEKDSSENQIEYCICDGGIRDKGTVKPGWYCPQALSYGEYNYGVGTRTCQNDWKVGDICSSVWPGLHTCNEDGSCTEKKNSSTLPLHNSTLISKGPSFSSLTNKVFAETPKIDGVHYLIDSETGLFVNLPIGVYIVEYKGEIYSIEVNTMGEGIKTLLYFDENKNGIFDEGVDINLSENSSILNIAPVELAYAYHLEQGFNFVSLPFLLELDGSPTTAAMLLQYLNQKFENSIYSIAKYGSSWEIVGQNVEIYSSNDFQLLPGQGYVIKAKKDLDITLKGQPVKFETTSDQAPVTFFPGWNLIGVYGTKVKQYTAKSMLQDINAFEEIDFTADIVNGWDQDAQSYEGFVLENTNGIESEYGFDFPINTLKSYFVRVADGKGNWQPSLAE